MPTFKTLVNYLTNPARLRERLIEKRMSARARDFLDAQTDAEADNQRESLLGDAVRALVEEARALPVYTQIVEGRNDEVVRTQTTSLADCITMYVLVRLYQPRVMVETGVFFGAMSAMILEAMAANGGGRLYSIDLPFDGDGLSPDQRGSLVPAARRDDWSLILGDSRDELPPLLQQLGTIDAFNHDSLHTTQHMMWEYGVAWPRIKPGGFLSSHDVLTTPAWARFCNQQRSMIAHEGVATGLGFAIKQA